MEIDCTELEYLMFFVAYERDIAARRKVSKSLLQTLTVSLCHMPSLPYVALLIALDCVAGKYHKW